ncbi:MAG: elongation factor Ts, partial [bacterium]|nr:elongation factor Ts [bacterium]
NQNKPADIVERILSGKLDKFFEDVCLLEQPTIKEPKLKVLQLVAGAIQKLGENIVVARFSRFQLGEKDKQELRV